MSMKMIFIWPPSERALRSPEELKHLVKSPYLYFDKKLDKSLDSPSSYRDQTNKINQSIDHNIIKSEENNEGTYSIKWVLIFMGLAYGVPGTFYLVHLMLS